MLTEYKDGRLTRERVAARTAVEMSALIQRLRRTGVVILTAQELPR